MPPKNQFDGSKVNMPSTPSQESKLNTALYKIEELESVFVKGFTERIREKLKENRNLILSEAQEINLKIKLARFLQNKKDGQNFLNQEFVNITDAITGTLKFLDTDIGGVEKLLEIHQSKTLQFLAERRRRIALQQNDDSFNPYENLFETNNGKYYMARLLNKQHLEEESAYLKHCVGQEGHGYIRKVASGEIEIFSFRDKVTGNPIYTIEYDRKQKTILQIEGLVNKHGRTYPSHEDECYEDLLEAIENLASTLDDNGQKRAIKNKFVQDQRMLISVCKKDEMGTELTKEELRFIYEIDGKIEGFGYQEDPRIKELLKKRNYFTDMKSIVNNKIMLKLFDKLEKENSSVRLDLFGNEGVNNIETKPQTHAQALNRYENSGGKTWVWETLKTEMPYTTQKPKNLDVLALQFPDPFKRTSENIVEWMKNNDLRPLTYEEHIEYITTHPEHQKKNYLLSLGTKAMLDGDLRVPSADWSGS